MTEITRILDQIDSGDPAASAELLPLVYDELRKLAAQRLNLEKGVQTLQATALVHEAYIRLVDGGDARCWDSRGHFFAAAAEAMRRILVERARQRKSLKRGGDRQRVELDDVPIDPKADTLDVLALDDALLMLEAHDARKAQLVKLRFFGGLTIPEAAAVLGVCSSTADNDWAYARCWLRLEMLGEEKQSSQE